MTRTELWEDLVHRRRRWEQVSAIILFMAFLWLLSGPNSPCPQAYPGEREPVPRQTVAISDPVDVPPGPGEDQPPFKKYSAKYTTINGIETLSFDIYVATDKYRWRLGKYDQVEFQGKTENPEVHLKSAGMENEVKDADGLIFVGAASQEGVDADQHEILASRRAERIDFIYEKVSFKKTNLPRYRFCLSRHRPEPGDTSHQRPLIIVKMISLDPNFNLYDARKVQAIALALLSQRKLPFQIGNFNRQEFSCMNCKSSSSE